MKHTICYTQKWLATGVECSIITLDSFIRKQTVLKSYGNGQDDQLLFFVPSTQQRPVFMERVEGELYCIYKSF